MTPQQLQAIRERVENVNCECEGKDCECLTIFADIPALLDYIEKLEAKINERSV